MALRRASLSLLKALQAQNAGVGVRPAGACLQFSTSAPVSDSRWGSHDALDRNAYRRNFTQQLHSIDQAKNDDHETFHYESSKMTAEGGGAEEKSFQEKSAEVLSSKAEKLTGSDDVKGKTEDAAETVKDKTEDAAETVKDKTEDAAGTVKDKTEDAAGTVKDQASKEADTAKDSVKDVPQKVSETATGLKEVGVEAGKAVVRDAGKVAEKVGLTSDSEKVTGTATELKEVGQEAGKAVVRDAKKVAEKVGLK